MELGVPFRSKGSFNSLPILVGFTKLQIKTDSNRLTNSFLAQCDLTIFLSPYFFQYAFIFHFCCQVDEPLLQLTYRV